ncbi:MAG: TolC family protein [Xanthomonadales bacterium]|nr:TolC family protein [Xanthomonadales bacterium]
MFRFYSTRRRAFAWPLVVGFCVSGLPLLTSSAATLAEQAPPALRDALQGAWQDHPLHDVTEAQLAAASARRDAAGQPLYNPELEFQINDEGEDRSATAGFSLTLDLGGKRRARRDAAGARLDEAIAEARQRRRVFIHDWLVAWTDLHTAAQRIALGERRLALVARFAGLAERQFLADDISSLERDLATLAHDEALVEQSKLESDLSNAKAALVALGGAGDHFPTNELATGSLPETVGMPGDLQAQPDWQVAQARAQASTREVVVARRNRIADPTLGISGGRIDYGSFRDNVIAISLSVPLFVRNTHASEVVAAQADADAADAEIAHVRLKIDAERQRATTNYASSRRAWSRWQSSRGTDIEHRAQLLERLWREGELSTADTLLQLRQTLDTALAGIELEARVWRDYGDILAAADQLERWVGWENTP